MDDASIAAAYHRRVPRSLPLGITIAILVGLGAALAGVIDGIVLMAKRTVKDCPNGTFFPVGTTNFNCYAHPRAGEGLAYFAISLGVGVVVLLLGYLSFAVSKSAQSS